MRLHLGRDGRYEFVPNLSFSESRSQWYYLIWSQSHDHPPPVEWTCHSTVHLAGLGLGWRGLLNCFSFQGCPQSSSFILASWKRTRTRFCRVLNSTELDTGGRQLAMASFSFRCFRSSISRSHSPVSSYIWNHDDNIGCAAGHLILWAERLFLPPHWCHKYRDPICLDVISSLLQFEGTLSIS